MTPQQILDDMAVVMDMESFKNNKNLRKQRLEIVPTQDEVLEKADQVRAMSRQRIVSQEKNQ